MDEADMVGDKAGLVAGLAVAHDATTRLINAHATDRNVTAQG
jgi:hypothetical protein